MVLSSIIQQSFRTQRLPYKIEQSLKDYRLKNVNIGKQNYLYHVASTDLKLIAVLGFKHKSISLKNTLIFRWTVEVQENEDWLGKGKIQQQTEVYNSQPLEQMKACVLQSIIKPKRLQVTKNLWMFKHFKESPILIDTKVLNLNLWYYSTSLHKNLSKKHFACEATTQHLKIQSS